MGGRADGREGARRRSRAGPTRTRRCSTSDDDRRRATATEAARLRAAGAVLVGLTTSPEFGSTNWTRSYLHGVTRNPWNPERTPGGSSGGSAAAVAVGHDADLHRAATAAARSASRPSYSGLFGFKVSFGRVGDDGRVRQRRSRRCPGPMCRSVRDAARYVDAIAGPTDVDPTSLPRPARPYEDCRRSRATPPHALRGKRAAWSSTLGFAVCDPEVEKVAYEAALALVADAGIELVDVDVALPKPSGAWGILSSLDGRRAITARPRAVARRRHAGVARRVRVGRTARRASRCSRALRRRDETARRDRRGVRRGRPVAHADHRDDRVHGRRAAAVRDRGPARRRHGFGAVHRAVQHLGQPGGEHPGRARRPTGCRSACRSSRAATKRSSCSACGARRRDEPPVAQVRPDGVHLIAQRSGTCSKRSGTAALVTDVHPRCPAAAAAAGAGASVRGGHRGRAGRAAHAAADLDAGPRAREHVRPRRRPRAHRRRPRPARSAVVEGDEGAAQDRGLPRQGHPHRASSPTRTPTTSAAPAASREKPAPSSSRTTRSRRGR